MSGKSLKIVPSNQVAGEDIEGNRNRLANILKHPIISEDEASRRQWLSPMACRRTEPVSHSCSEYIEIRKKLNRVNRRSMMMLLPAKQDDNESDDTVIENQSNLTLCVQNEVNNNGTKSIHVVDLTSPDLIPKISRNEKFSCIITGKSAGLIHEKSAESIDEKSAESIDEKSAGSIDEKWAGSIDEKSAKLIDEKSVGVSPKESTGHVLDPLFDFVLNDRTSSMLNELAETINNTQIRCNELDNMGDTIQDKSVFVDLENSIDDSTVNQLMDVSCEDLAGTSFEKSLPANDSVEESTTLIGKNKDLVEIESGDSIIDVLAKLTINHSVEIESSSNESSPLLYESFDQERDKPSKSDTDDSNHDIEENKGWMNGMIQSSWNTLKRIVNSVPSSTAANDNDVEKDPYRGSPSCDVAIMFDF